MAAIYNDRITQAVNNLTNQLNINASRDLQREQLGLQRLSDTQSMMIELDRNRRANELQKAQVRQMEQSEKRAAAAEARAVKQFNLSIAGLKFNQLRFQNAIDPTNVNIGEWFTANPYLKSQLSTNANFRNDIAKVFGPNMKLDSESMNIIKPNGQVLKISGYEKGLKGIQLLGIAEAYLDPAAGLTAQQTDLQNTIKNLSKQYKQTNERDVAEKAFLASELGKAKSQLISVNDSFNPMKLLTFYRRKDNLLRTAAIIAASNMADPAYVNLLSSSLAQNSKRMGELQKEILKLGGTGEGKTQQHFAVLLDNNGNIIDERLMNAPKNIPQGMLPSTIDPSLKGYVWSDMPSLQKTTKEGEKGLMTESAKLHGLRENFGRFNEKGQFIQDKELTLDRMNAEFALADSIKNEPNLSGVAQIAKVTQWANNLHEEYINLHTQAGTLTREDIAKKLREKNQTPSEEKIYETVMILHENIDNWWNTQSYIQNKYPKRQYSELEAEARTYFIKNKRLKKEKTK